MVLTILVFIFTKSNALINITEEGRKEAENSVNI